MNSLLVTFHASHNYGSALQAYATQSFLAEIGVDNTILNFQMPSQKKYYSLYGGRNGMKIREFTMLPLHFQRKNRQNKFYEFQNKYFKMTPEVNSYEQINELDLNKYDLFISGADQIWSNNIPEFKQSRIDYKGIFFGNFINCKKISFSSSLGNASLNYIKSKVPDLKKYDHISLREKRGQAMLNPLLNINCDLSLDPTFLIDDRQYTQMFDLDISIIPNKYILVYTLQGIKSGKKWKKSLQKLSKKTGYKIIVVSPFFPIIGKGLTNLVDVGPIDYLNLVKNASFVLTDTFHGTAFSIIFRKKFLVYQDSGNKDPRKIDLLKRFKLEDRIINDRNSEKIINFENINYSYEESLISDLINRSKEILKEYVYE